MSRIRSVAAATVSALALAFGMSATTIDNKKTFAESSDQQFTEECPHDGVSVYRKQKPDRPPLLQFSPISLTGTGRITLSGGIQAIPEFHDCQRFIVGPASSPSYGPLIAIFAREGLDTVLNVLGEAGPPVFIADALPDTIASMKTIAAIIGRQPNPAAGVPDAIAAATIVSWDSRTPNYTPLGLPLGVSCLYMGFNTMRQWVAFHQSNGMDANCPTFPRLNVLAVELKVFQNPLPSGLNPSDIAPVARWDWDDVRREQYIGIRCGSHYCEIGRGGFHPSPALTPPPQFSTGRARRVFTKSWYDRQILAKAAQNASGALTLIPSGEMGVIVPWPHLDALVKGNFPTQGPGIPVAMLYVSGNVYDRPAKWNLKPGMPPQITNVMTAWIPGSAGNIWAGLVGRPQPNVIQAGSTIGGGPFFNGATRPVVVTFRASAWGKTHHIPGTTVWRWEATDETTWYRCPTGCCEPN